jgi:bacterioferritin (cytochrome b1)
MADSKKDRDANKDTGATVGGAFAGGAVGGVAGGAMAGAAAGGLGGPAGAAIGAAVGAVAGAMGGKAIASRINPQSEDEHWRTNYASRPYVTSGSTYDDYGPAYKLGYERYPEYHGKSFDEAESNLERDWDSQRGRSRLQWNEAKHATRDAYERVRDTVTRDDTGGTYTAGTAGAYAAGEYSEDAVKDLNKLLRGELAATETYRQALDKIRGEFGRDARFQQLAQIHKEHDQAASDLRSLVQKLGGTPSDDSGAWGAWSNTVMGAARIFGDKSALSALLSGERSGVDDYQDALKQQHTPDQLRHVYRANLTRNQEHIQQLETLIDAT